MKKANGLEKGLRIVQKVRWFLVVGCVISLTACQTDGVSVTEKVLADFGLRERPEGYVSGSDRVFEQMDQVGAAELKRLNTQGRHGEIKYEEEGRRGSYYKEVKVYESFVPVDVSGSTGGGTRDRGFTGVIEYRYKIFRSERKPTRTEAAAESATIETGQEGKEAYRYYFSTSGLWDGAPGERTRL